MLNELHTRAYPLSVAMSRIPRQICSLLLAKFTVLNPHCTLESPGMMLKNTLAWFTSPEILIPLVWALVFFKVLVLSYSSPSDSDVYWVRHLTPGVALKYPGAPRPSGTLPSPEQGTRERERRPSIAHGHPPPASTGLLSGLPRQKASQEQEHFSFTFCQITS